MPEWAGKVAPRKVKVTMHSKKLSLVLFGLVAVLVAGCGYGKTACAVVDAADKACTVVRYMAPDGTVQEVRVEQDEINRFGRAAAAKRDATKAPAEEPASDDEKGAP